MTRNILFVAISMLCSINALAGTPEEDLADKLFAIRAVSAAGVSYQEFAEQITDLVIKVDRYKRNGGSNTKLLEAAKDYIVSKNLWNEKNSRSSSPGLQELEDEVNQITDELIQQCWQKANKLLTEFEQAESNKPLRRTR